MQLAKLIGDIATGQTAPLGVSEEVRRYMSELGKRGGKKGGAARKRSLTKKQRQEIARKAAKARWKKLKGPGTP